MTLEQVKQLFQMAEIQKLCRQHGIARLSVFGSTARNEATEKSDLDLLVSFDASKRIGMREFFSLEDELAEATKQKIDLVMESSLSGRRAKYIKQDAQVIYAS